MEAMRSAAHIKSGCELLSRAGNEASSAGWAAMAGGGYNSTTVSMLGIWPLCSVLLFLPEHSGLEIGWEERRGQSLWWYMAFLPKPRANGNDKNAHGPNTW